MIVDLSGFYGALDQEPLAVRGLHSGNYELKINGPTIGQFSAAQLDQESTWRNPTPMLLQAYDVLDLVYKEVSGGFMPGALSSCNWHSIMIRPSSGQPIVYRRLVRGNG